MALHGKLYLAACFLFFSVTPVRSSLAPPDALNLRITNNITHEIPSTLYGYMWEIVLHAGIWIWNINVDSFSGDGGLYAELLQNRAFQGVIPGTQNALNAWQSYNGARLSVTSKTDGISAALPNSLQVQIPKVISGPIGFENTGYWGIKVQEGWTYNGSFYVKSDTYASSITVSLKSSRGTVFASQTLTGVSSSWNKLAFELSPITSAANDDNVFNVALDGEAAAGQTVYFGLFSLFPPTYNGRPNGMRIDLAEAMAATNPTVWRFPGGNNLEGDSIDTRWKWNETIGPLEDRPGRIGTWSYPNTDGLGLLEYLNWAEDLGAVRVWDGIALGNYTTLDGFTAYIDDVLNEIEFITGNTSTKWGQVRASLGREEPYALRFIEIGNEDQVALAGSTRPAFFCSKYAAYRWSAFVNAIGAEYPEMQFLATSLPSLALDPPYKRIDFHQYDTATFFETFAFFFDSYPRNSTRWFVGEYAVTSTNETNPLALLTQGRLLYPTLAGSTAEAAFMTGMERNSDVVFASAYAPSLQHLKNYQWTPNIISFDASHIVKSTSYYVQQMFSTNRGTHVLTTSPTSDNNSVPLYWVSNTGPDDLVGNIVLDFATPGYATAISLGTPALSPITGSFNISNTIEEPEQITPVASSFTFQDPTRFNYTFPATSVTVLAVQSINFNSSSS
ncbi:glycoside hydrolase [Gymnopus androsaceus JB14]|uniref:non-reducing end alpha-L-arabinofuranosidase n=1 Tax=Gymnopus androsaceus JB14 TaxID=1447944 RepID=A0A6A4HT40_9AGAR|nr:glycoside hydrolase [Gymnopus androsaceus JB14]